MRGGGRDARGERNIRYDVGAGGFTSNLIVLDSYTRNVRRSGSAYVGEDGVWQYVAWLVWDYGSTSSLGYWE